MMRTERESGRRRREVKWQTCWCCRDQQRACKMAQDSAEKLEDTGPTEKERLASIPHREQLARTPEPTCQKEKEQIRQSKAVAFPRVPITPGTPLDLFLVNQHFH